MNTFITAKSKGVEDADARKIQSYLDGLLLRRLRQSAPLREAFRKARARDDAESAFPKALIITDFNDTLEQDEALVERYYSLLFNSHTTRNDVNVVIASRDKSLERIRDSGVDECLLEGFLDKSDITAFYTSLAAIAEQYEVVFFIDDDVMTRTIVEHKFGDQFIAIDSADIHAL